MEIYYHNRFLCQQSKMLKPHLYIDLVLISSQNNCFSFESLSDDWAILYFIWSNEQHTYEAKYTQEYG